jgi:hypothetical protein
VIQEGGPGRRLTVYLRKNNPNTCSLRPAANFGKPRTIFEQGHFKWDIWGVPEISLLERVKTEVEIRDRTHQLIQEWLDRVVGRAKKPTPDMADQAQVFRKAANDLESEIIDCDEVRPPPNSNNHETVAPT